MEFEYFLPTRILFGRGQLNNLSKQDLPYKKALIVVSAGKSVKVNGYLDRVIRELKAAGIESAVFDKILPNPIKKHVNEGAAAARAEGADVIVGLGGGSSIDSAKAIAVMATNEGDYWDYIDAGSGKNLPVKNAPLPIIAITTTAGTGTEADPWTVVTNEEKREKIGFGYDKTFPVLSIVDPELMLTVPPTLTAYQGFDALFHSTEGYLNVRANPISDALCLEAIRLIGSNLAAAVKNGGDIEAREKVALANTLSGMVETLSGCTSEHSMEHALSAYRPELPHGAGLIALSLPYYRFYAKRHIADERLSDMGKALGGDASPEGFLTALENLQRACGVFGIKLTDYGIEKARAAEYADNAFETMGGLFTRERYVMTREECAEIIAEAIL